MTEDTDIISQIFQVSDDIKDSRTVSEALLYAMTEIGECSEEHLISTGYSSKKAGADGVVGEAIDAIICLIDVIHLHDKTVTKEKLEEITKRKLVKWKSKSKS